MKPNPLLTLNLELGDMVLTPTRRKAVVVGFMSDKVQLRYLDDHEQVTLSAKHLTLLSRGRNEDRGPSKDS